MTALKLVRPSTEAEKITRSTNDIIRATVADLKKWQTPPFQRQIRLNEKVREIAQQMKSQAKDDEAVIPGDITLGVLGGITYLIDGQHRREAFYLTELDACYCEIRIKHYKSMKEMSNEFRNVNSHIVSMRPDDHLRAFEMESEPLARLRRECPFVGYDMVRRGESAPLLSMSTTIRSWAAAGKEVPVSGGISGGAMRIAEFLTEEDVDHLVQFLNIAKLTWGSDKEYLRLWGNLNLTVCMWLFRRTVIAGYSAKSARLTPAQFSKCMTALSASEAYLEWLRSRTFSETNRSPAYKRVKDLFVKRLSEELGRRPNLPQPAWGGRGGAT